MPMQSLSGGDISALPGVNGYARAPLERQKPPSSSNSTKPEDRVLYRLSAVVCHYGTHSFGHYISYRRKPPSANAGQEGWEPPTLILTPSSSDSSSSAIKKEAVDDEWEDELDDTQSQSKLSISHAKEKTAYAFRWASNAESWLRISDISVSEVEWRDVREEGRSAFMLYYEKVKIIVEDPSAPPPAYEEEAKEEVKKEEQDDLMPNGDAKPKVKPKLKGAKAKPDLKVKPELQTPAEILSTLSYSYGPSAAEGGFAFQAAAPQATTTVPGLSFTTKSIQGKSKLPTLSSSPPRPALKPTPSVSARVWRNSTLPAGFVTPQDLYADDSEPLIDGAGPVTDEGAGRSADQEPGVEREMEKGVIKEHEERAAVTELLPVIDTETSAAAGEGDDNHDGGETSPISPTADSKVPAVSGDGDNKDTEKAKRKRNRNKKKGGPSSNAKVEH
jgi:hypothetical protein